MKKVKRKRIPSSTTKIFPILILVATIFMSVGYASINSIIINISGEVIAKEQDGIFITEIEYIERSDSLPNENYSISYADNTILKSLVTLEPDDLTSEVSLKISFCNSTEDDYVFKDVVYAEELTDEVDDVYSNSNIVYTFDKKNEIITKNGGTLEVIITFKYSDINESTSNILNSILNFKFDLTVHVVASYDYTGDYETFVVPYDGIYRIELWGAQGAANKGGNGGYTSGEIELTETEELYIYVGEHQDRGVLEMAFNGGGGVQYEDSGDEPVRYNTGGGATDIRLTKGEWNDFESLKSRIMVAGAGGGGYEGYASNNYVSSVTGGVGGGLIGGSGGKIQDSSDPELIIAYGGTQISGGLAGIGKDLYETADGAFGSGGYPPGKFLAGGGGGYYGGGSSGVYPKSPGSGAGGSSFISGHNGCDAILESSIEDYIVHTGQSVHYSKYQFSNTIIIDGNGYNWTTEIGDYTGMPTHDGTSTMTGNTGNGYAKITYLRSE